MKSKLDVILDDLETTLKGSDDTEEMQKAVRYATVKSAAQDMSDEEKLEARKAFDTDENDTETKDSMSEGEDEDETITAKKSKKSKKSKKAKTSNDDDEDEAKTAMEETIEEQKQHIATLAAAVSSLKTEPLVNEMVQIRIRNGMSPENATKFRKGFYGQPVDAIKQRYEEDKSLYTNKPLVASTIPGVEIPFVGGVETALNASGTHGSEKTLEEMLQ